MKKSEDMSRDLAFITLLSIMAFSLVLCSIAWINSLESKIRALEHRAADLENKVSHQIKLTCIESGGVDMIITNTMVICHSQNSIIWSYPI